MLVVSMIGVVLASCRNAHDGEFLSGKRFAQHGARPSGPGFRMRIFDTEGLTDYRARVSTILSLVLLK
jgi:hypothetical protein